MRSERTFLAVFTGTGNTLLAARYLADALSRRDHEVKILPMEHWDASSLPKEAALGIAVPLACFSTYPTAWRFIEGLPAGEGREVHFLATMGGASGGMEGPIRRVVERKGYRPVGAKIVRMPSNYANRTIPVRENEEKMRAAGDEIEAYAGALAQGQSRWGGGIAASLFARMAHGRLPWRLFNRFFPLTVDAARCVSCGRCRDICPERNIAMREGVAEFGDRCQSCQRCVAFCPAGAIAVPGKPAEPYRALPFEEMSAFLEGGDA